MCTRKYANRELIWLKLMRVYVRPICSVQDPLFTITQLLNYVRGRYFSIILARGVARISPRGFRPSWELKVGTPTKNQKVLRIWSTTFLEGPIFFSKGNKKLGKIRPKGVPRDHRDSSSLRHYVILVPRLNIHFSRLEMFSSANLVTKF